MQHLFDFHSNVPSNGFVNKRYELTTGPLARQEWKSHMFDERNVYPNRASPLMLLSVRTLTQLDESESVSDAFQSFFPSMICILAWWVSVCARVLVYVCDGFACVRSVCACLCLSAHLCIHNYKYSSELCVHVAVCVGTDANTDVW